MGNPTSMSASVVPSLLRKVSESWKDRRVIDKWWYLHGRTAMTQMVSSYNRDQR